MGQVWVIRVVGSQGTVMNCQGVLGGFVSAYDPDAFGGHGDVAVTQDLQEAIQFPDPHLAAKFYRRRSHLRPTRGDGQPNRPLTALTVQILPVDVM